MRINSIVRRSELAGSRAPADEAGLRPGADFSIATRINSAAASANIYRAAIAVTKADRGRRSRVSPTSRSRTNPYLTRRLQTELQLSYVFITHALGCAIPVRQSCCYVPWEVEEAGDRGYFRYA